MRWLFQDHPLRHERPAEYFMRKLTHESEGTMAAALVAATVRGTVYAAVRSLNKQTGASYVFCAVILFKNSKRDGFGYKMMDEGMGPCEVACPNRIMRLLSPIADIPDPSCAADWRARVAAAKADAAKLRSTLAGQRVGDEVKLASPAHFSKSGISADLFTFVRFHGRTPIFVAVVHPTLFAACTSPRSPGPPPAREARGPPP